MFNIYLLLVPTEFSFGHVRVVLYMYPLVPGISYQVPTNFCVHSSSSITVLIITIIVVVVHDAFVYDDVCA